MHSYHLITNSVTVKYKYSVSPNQHQKSKKAFADVSLIVKPPLTICKSSSTSITSLGEPFYYKIKLTNISSYPIHVCIYDHIPKCLCYDNFSFIKDKQILSYVDFSNWLYIGKLAAHSSTYLYYKASLIADYNIEEFSNIVYGCYYQESSKCMPVIWNLTRSNECIIKVRKDWQC